MLVIYITGTLSVFTAFYKSYHQASFQQKVIRAERPETEKLFFTEEEYGSLSWEEEDREFEWHGKMYDVNKIVKTKKGFEMYCMNDEWEEKIKNLFTDWKQLPSPLGKSKLYFQPQFCNVLDFGHLISHSRRSKTDHYCDVSYSQPFISFTSPPPEVSRA